MSKIDWDAIESHRKTMAFHQVVRSSKIMHGWLPIMHNQGKWGTHITQCPGCTCRDETFAHMIQCPHRLMREKRTEILRDVLIQCQKRRIPKRVAQAIREIIGKLFTGESNFASPTHTPSIARAVQAQETIGMLKLLQGFPAIEWRQAMVSEGTREHIPRHMRWILGILLNHVIEPLWTTRNHILHKTPNRYNEDDNGKLGERLTWYRENRYQLLPYHQHRLAEHDADDIERMSNTVRREWVRHLDTARAVYESECAARQHGQTTMTETTLPTLLHPPPTWIPRTPPPAPRKQRTRIRKRFVQMKLTADPRYVANDG
jgi:hypothetical protein